MKKQKDIKTLLRKILGIPMHIFWILPIKRNRIVFQSFKGNEYSDSCKAIVEYIHSNYPGQYDMYWVAEDVSTLELPDYKELHSVKKNTLKYFYICQTAKIAVCNINQESNMPLRKSQKLINTWHGMPYKTVGLARVKDNQIVNYNVYNLFLSPCKFYTDNVIRDSFHYVGRVLECGLPRNDIFFKQDNQCIKTKVYNTFKIDTKIKTVLFAPTFRGNFESINTKLDYEGVLNSLQERFGGMWRMLYREHPMLTRSNKQIDGVINVTFYPDMMELLVACDVLITDYSSSMWDFALTRRPIFLYTPDLDNYTKDRGFYVDMEKLPFMLGHDNAELEEKIVNFNDEKYYVELDNYFDEMGNYEKGHACDLVTRVIREWCM